VLYRIVRKFPRGRTDGDRGPRPLVAEKVTIWSLVVVQHPGNVTPRIWSGLREAVAILVKWGRPTRAVRTCVEMDRRGARSLQWVQGRKSHDSDVKCRAERYHIRIGYFSIYEFGPEKRRNMLHRCGPEYAHILSCVNWWRLRRKLTAWSIFCPVLLLPNSRGHFFHWEILYYSFRFDCWFPITPNTPHGIIQSDLV
jgi:hypothetical protein